MLTALMIYFCCHINAVVNNDIIFVAKTRKLYENKSYQGVILNIPAKSPTGKNKGIHV